jgi:hypothetical protein
MHLLELIIIVSVLGNAIGFTLLYSDEIEEWARSVWLAALIFTEVLWILGGATWALRCMTVLRVEDTWPRLRLLLLGLLAPLCPLAMLAIIPAMASIPLGHGTLLDKLLLLAGSVIYILALLLLYFAWQVERNSRSAHAALGKDKALKKGLALKKDKAPASAGAETEPEQRGSDGRVGRE